MGLNGIGAITTNGCISAFNNKVEITMERYEQLIEAEVKLKAIKDVLEADTSSYGYSESTSRTIDVLVGIDRNEK